MKERLSLTHEILEKVLYGMENQDEDLALDIDDGCLVRMKPGSSDLIPLPPWEPADGFRLMESFAASLRPTPYREELMEVLYSGHSVFRKFKDMLKVRPDVEARWKQFKSWEMKKLAISWFSRWSEALELESLEPEPEDWHDLTLSDFLIRPAGDGDAGPVGELLKGFLDECRSRASVSILFPTTEEAGHAFSMERCFVAESPEGLVVGFSRFETQQTDAVIHEVYVQPSHRILGLGEQLIQKAAQSAREQGCRAVYLLTKESGTSLEAFLEKSGFRAEAVLWRSD